MKHMTDDELILLYYGEHENPELAAEVARSPELSRRFGVARTVVREAIWPRRFATTTTDRTSGETSRQGSNRKGRLPCRIGKTGCLR